MMTGTITDDGARGLSAFIHSIRGDWDVAGIRSALSSARLRAPSHELGIAAIRCAMGDARTPAVIGMDGPHWAGLVEHARVVRPADLARCDVHGLFLPCRSCAGDMKGAPDDARPDTLAPVSAADRAEVKRRADIARAVLRQHTTTSEETNR